MATNVLSRDEVALEQNNSIVGSNRLRYEMYINHLIGGEINKSTGTLKNAKHKELTYNVLQKFPEDTLADVISAASTEFPQVQAGATEFDYCQVAVAVEFTLSELQGITNTANIDAGILNNLYKQYDAKAYAGSYGNVGFANNPLRDELPAMALDHTANISTAISAILKEMKATIGVRKSNYSQIAIGMTSDIAEIWNQVDPDNASGQTVGQIIENAFSGITFEEIPDVISNGASYIEAAYRPMVTLWHGARPSLYSSETRRHGLEKGNLFAFESAAIQIEDFGAYVVVPKK